MLKMFLKYARIKIPKIKVHFDKKFKTSKFMFKVYKSEIPPNINQMFY